MSKNDDLVALSSVELRRRIGSKEISPVELMEASIARMEALNPSVNAICATAYGRARREADAAEKAALAGEPLGPLHGLPTGIKDLHDTEGLLTTHGSPLYRDHIPTHDCAMVANVRKAGAIVVAKTNVPEFGAGANTRNPVWGATGNPFDTRLNAGGSSGGSAVALACDMLPVCTGSDTGGSLRIPAAYCGVVGLRPSPGLVPMEMRQLGWTPIRVLGPMGRTVADVRQLFAAQIGMDDREPLAFALAPERVAAGRPADLSRLRVAWTEDFGQCPVTREIRHLMRERITAMRHLFRSCDVVTFDFGEADRCFDVVRALNFVAGYHAAYTKDPSSLGPNVRTNYEMGAAMSLPDAAWAHAEQTRIFRRFQADIPRLRPGAVAHDPGVAQALDGALPRRSRRQAAQELLPLAGAHLFHHAGDQPGHLASLRPRPERHAVRLAGDGALPWRPRGARRRRGDGGRVHAHCGPRPAAPGPRQAGRRVRRPQVAGDASTCADRGVRRQKRRPRTRRGLWRDCQPSLLACRCRRAACELRPLPPRPRGISRCPCAWTSCPPLRRSAGRRCGGTCPRSRRPLRWTASCGRSRYRLVRCPAG